MAGDFDGIFRVDARLTLLLLLEEVGLTFMRELLAALFALEERLVVCRLSRVTTTLLPSAPALITAKRCPARSRDLADMLLSLARLVVVMP